MFEFRHSQLRDIDYMEQIATDAKALLKSKGISQWQRGTYPDRALFLRDVDEGIGYVVSDGDAVAAICAVTFTDEAAYRGLTGGEWLTDNNSLYATIHRSASAKEYHGKHVIQELFAAAAKMAKERGAVSIRIDTHPDNISMQRALAAFGFVKCGELILPDGDEEGDLRYGYEYLIQ